MEPMLKYRGGKRQEICHFSKYFPEFTGRYVEPFLGGGAVYFYLEPALAIINDLNRPLMGFYRDVQRHFGRLRAELDQLAFFYKENRKKFLLLKGMLADERVPDQNELMYYRLRDEFNDLGVSLNLLEGTVYYFINKTAFSGMIRLNQQGEFNVPFGHYASFSVDQITTDHCRLLKHAALYNEDFAAVFKLCERNDFIFLDPPYDCVFHDYGNVNGVNEKIGAEKSDGFNQDDHVRLCSELCKLHTPWLMVIGETPLTASLYRGMVIDRYQKHYAVNIRNRFKSDAVHLIVSNYRMLYN